LLKLAVRLIVVGVVLYAVGGTLRDAVEGLRRSPIRPHLGWALAGAAAYLPAYLPIAFFWRGVLRAWRQPCRSGLVLRSYYISHLGKYVPGKAMVIVLRTTMLNAAGGRTGPVAASVLVETLTLMSVGGVISGLLLIIPSIAKDHPGWLVALAFALAAACALPTLPPVMNRLIAFFERRREARLNQSEGPATDQTDPDEWRPFTWRLFATGWGAATATWYGLALSLWISVRALAPGFPATLENGLVCLLAAALPVVAGYLSLIPGGLLVRDGLMTLLLTPATGPEVALAATVLVRLTWVASEALLCVILVVGGKMKTGN
jgi:uncharacterized membrane protein YbhN (UPF0104 family)